MCKQWASQSLHTNWKLFKYNILNCKVKIIYHDNWVIKPFFAMKKKTWKKNQIKLILGLKLQFKFFFTQWGERKKMKVHKKAFDFYNKGFEKTNIQCSCVSLPLQWCSMRDYWIAKTIIDGVEVVHTQSRWACYSLIWL
jgi:hypothetical protein